MSTTLPDVVARARALVEPVGQGWNALDGPLSPVAAPEGDRHFDLRPFGGPVVQDAFGFESEQMLAQDLLVTVYRLLAGDPLLEEPAFLEEARAVADALEVGAGWPAGFHVLRVMERGGVERGYDVEDPESPWARIRITARAFYQAPYGT